MTNDDVVNKQAADQALLERYEALKTELGEVKLLVVSKYAPDDAVQPLIDAGHRDFGESRPQHLRDRAEAWPDCNWHMIGPMQRNKAKYVGRSAAMWHSCDSLEMAEAVARHVTGRPLPVLIQVNVGDVAHQQGIAPDVLGAFADQLDRLPALTLAGLMCMAPQHGDTRAAFARLRGLRDSLFGGSVAELCMGMSGDYRIAVEEGATMVRLGSTLFGDRDIRLNREQG